MENIKVLFSAERIEAQVEFLAKSLRRDLSESVPVMVCVLNGAFMFYSDLVKRMGIPVTCDFVRVSSYGNAMSSSGVVKLGKDVESDLSGRDVVIVEDIVDSGLSIDTLKRHFLAKNPRSIRVCSLLKKETAPPGIVDYCGFVFREGFIVGYGIDCAERYRELNYIGEVRASV